MSRTVALVSAFVALATAVAVLVYLNFFAAAPEPRERAVVATPVPPGAAPPEPGATTETAIAPRAAGPVAGKKKLLLYFQGVDIDLLFPEERLTEGAADGNAQARLVLDELIKGPTKDLLPTIPSGTKVREVYFDANGVAYVDFTHELRDGHIGGSAEELMTVESIVNTLARNVPEVQAVLFLIDGRPVQTLAGHVDLQTPLRPSSDRLALTP